MYCLLNKLKSNAPEVPISIGSKLAFIPFNLRPGIGSLYKKQSKLIHNYASLDEQGKQSLIFNSFYKIFKHAYLNIPFYNKLYKIDNHIQLTDIKSFDDIKNIPIVNKKMLNAVPLENRSFNISNRLLVNTGGSSGKPFSFYMDPLRYGNEWAHIHHMWSYYGYKPKSLKLSFDGRSGNLEPVYYDFIRNSLCVNINNYLYTFIYKT